MKDISRYGTVVRIYIILRWLLNKGFIIPKIAKCGSQGVDFSKMQYGTLPYLQNALPEGDFTYCGTGYPRSISKCGTLPFCKMR